MLCVRSARLLGYQHVGISNAKRSRLGSKLTRLSKPTLVVLHCSGI